ncbi:hypothetical protein EJ03DRAFT_370325 [Teratosphaeria nubilosa]|uniref:Uncharacterized protein n=1 Tax=Teratosphaeria nubilosa TaxID=161662 RepID=A0A6G1LPY1_9PEZI|nr:hypothetical protein EJ03DRAFT_370325 [Teratosphaeria nubilosa]
MASSPSEFLTFYRRAATSSSLRNTLRTPRRAFAATARWHNVVSDKGTQQDTGPGQKTGGSREHALDKGDKKDPNLQSAESSFGREAASPRKMERLDLGAMNLSLRTGSEHFDTRDGGLDEAPYANASRLLRSARQYDTGGHATRQKDERNSTAKAKRDHPEAPDVVIGMQDERGGKGL